MNFPTDKRHPAPHGRIAHYLLDLQHKDGQKLYVWQCPPNRETDCRLALLIDLKGIYLPDNEIERLTDSLETPEDRICAIAFANCHAHNRQEIRRKLKAKNVRLFSHTAFFAGPAEAKQWLSSQIINC